MIDRLRSFFRTAMQPTASEFAESAGHRRHLAAAALLIEVMKADFHCREEELAAVRRALQELFGLTGTELDEIIALADEEVEQAVSLHGFTRLVNDNYTAVDKLAIMEMLWRVVLADGTIDKHEQHLMRKISSLLHIPHDDYVRAKIRARRHHGQSDRPG